MREDLQPNREQGPRDGPELVEVSVVMPCLNEEAALPLCIEEAQRAIEEMGLPGEVLVVDNGSTDRSVDVAARWGAKVVREENRGYGSACRRGLAEARGSIVVLGDADGSYDFGGIEQFVHPLFDDADLVIGTRLGGAIDHGAMPWLHRRIGNPFLTATMNALFEVGVSDAHCGLRSIRMERYLELPIASTGMEFASEMLIAAARGGLRISEVPIRYRRRVGGEPKLRTFLDGLRHLRLMAAKWRPASQRGHGGEGRSGSSVATAVVESPR